MANNALQESPSESAGLIGQFDPAAIASMTHNQLQRDAIAPVVQNILRTAGAFYHGGLHDVMQRFDVAQPNWSHQISQTLTSPAAEAALGVLSLKPIVRSAKSAVDRAVEPDFFHSYAIQNEKGQNVGPMLINAKDPKHLYIEWMGRGHDLESGANTLGPAEVRSLLQSVKKQYPNALTISGYRASGARFGGAAADESLKDKFGISTNEVPLIHLQNARRFIRDTAGKIRELKAMPEGFTP